MSLPIYQRVAVTDSGDVIPGAEYTVINENTGVAAPIYSDRTGATLLTAPYFADSAGTIQFFIAQGTTFRVAASGGVGTYTDRYVYGVAEAVLVQANGNIGIGTSSPDKIVDIVNASTPTLRIGDDIRTVELRGGSATQNPAIGTYYAGDFTIATNSAERLRITSAGQLLVGTATDTADGAKFQVSTGNSDKFISYFTGVNYGKATRLTTNGYADFFYTPTGFAGYISISTDNNTTSYTTASDYRLKTDIVPMVGATDKVKLLKPCNFEWINSGQRVDGFLAHELQEVIPAAAFGDKDEMMDESYEVTPAVLDNDGAEAEAAIIGTRSVPKWQTIDQAKIVPLLTATIQELIARIEILEAK